MMKRKLKFNYHGDRVSAGGGCEAAVTARTRCQKERSIVRAMCGLQLKDL